MLRLTVEELCGKGWTALPKSWSICSSVAVKSSMHLPTGGWRSGSTGESGPDPQSVNRTALLERREALVSGIRMTCVIPSPRWGLCGTSRQIHELKTTKRTGRIRRVRLMIWSRRWSIWPGLKPVCAAHVPVQLADIIKTVVSTSSLAASRR
jgi:hypothetical protein